MTDAAAAPASARPSPLPSPRTRGEGGVGAGAMASFSRRGAEEGNVHVLLAACRLTPQSTGRSPLTLTLSPHAGRGGGGAGAMAWFSRRGAEKGDVHVLLAACRLTPQSTGRSPLTLTLSPHAGRGGGGAVACASNGCVPVSPPRPSPRRRGEGAGRRMRGLRLARQFSFNTGDYHARTTQNRRLCG